VLLINPGPMAEVAIRNAAPEMEVKDNFFIIQELLYECFS
jgi:hypothetical protein